jgi:hypothetical protein
MLHESRPMTPLDFLGVKMTSNIAASSSLNQFISETQYDRLHQQAYEQAYEVVWQLALEEHPCWSFKAKRAWAEDVTERLASEHLELQLA